MSSSDRRFTSYEVITPIHKQFLKRPQVGLWLQEYVQNVFSIQIAIEPPEWEQPLYWHSTKKLVKDYRIDILGVVENETEMAKAASIFIKNLFETMQLQTFNDRNVTEWLRCSSTKAANLEFLQKIIEEKAHNVFIICKESSEHSLQIYYLIKEPGSISDSNDEINRILQYEISQETVMLPFRHEQSRKIMEISRKMTAKAARKDNVSVCFNFLYSASKHKQHSIVLFGDSKVVNQLKKDLLEVIDNHNVTRFQLNLDELQIDFLLHNCTENLKNIEKKYKQFGVSIQVRFKEFCAPDHLKDEIESSITQLLQHSATKTFKSIQLSKDIAHLAEKHLKNIAQRCHCYITNELRYKSRCYTIPKASSTTAKMPKSLMEQSDGFLSSSDVFSKIVVANGSIEIRMGDIALQEVDIIVIPTTFNGLRESVIERAGTFNHQMTYTDETSTKFTKTDGGKLSCRRILFSNWIPSTTSNDDDLRKSIQMFILKSIEYTIKQGNPTSIAFAVSDSCTNENILAHEMIHTAKQQLESKNLQLKIAFILLPEQRTLFRQFFSLSETMQDNYAHFDWTSVVIKTKLIGSAMEDVTKCQEKISKYLERCTTLERLANPFGIFQHWDQYTIISFYQYCKDKCVLAQIDGRKKELELVGPVNNVLEVKYKWDFLSHLSAEKLSWTQFDTKTSIGHVKAHNIMLSYCQRDSRKCQYLIKSLTEKDFSIWAEPVMTEQQRNASFAIDQSNCIILCISEDYYESESCEKEARYAFQSGKPVFLVKIQNHPLIGWQRELFEGKLFFQLFGSKNHFDLEFGKLLLEIVRFTKPGSASFIQSRSQHLLAVEQRQALHDEKIKRLIASGRIEENEMKTLVQELQNLMNDTDETITGELLEVIQRWLKKPTNITKQNLPPFTANGDINDAIFPMPDYVLKYLDLYVESFTPMPSSSIQLRNIFEQGIFKRPIDYPSTQASCKLTTISEERISGICTRKTECSDGLSQIFSAESVSVDDDDSQKATRLPVLSSESLPVKKNSRVRRHKLDNSNKMKKERQHVIKPAAKKYKPPTREELKLYLEKFAQLMRDNAMQFDTYCSKELRQNKFK